MVARIGLEPMYDAVKVHCVTTSPPSNKYFSHPISIFHSEMATRFYLSPAGFSCVPYLFKKVLLFFFMVREVGFEPTTDEI